jgi:ABC-2 type transport system permease protein
MLFMLYRRWRKRRMEMPAPLTAAAGATATTNATTTATTVQPAQPVAATRTRGAGNPVAMVLHQAFYDLRSFARNRQARFFTVLLPLLFLVIFVSVFGNDTVGPHHVKSATYYVPGLAAMAVIGGSFVNLVISITTERETGILKRRRATPVPAWVLIGGRTLMAMAISLGVMAVLLLVGRLAYGVQLPAQTIPAVVVTALLGSLAFCVLAYAFSSSIDNADAAQPMTQAVMLPLYFISGVFIPNVALPTWLQDVARIFPVQHLADGLHSAFDPTVQGSGFVGSDLGVLALWAMLGLLVAVRRFAWVPAAARA